MYFLRGGDEVTGATLSRFFGFHVAILPGIFVVILAIHLILIQRQGISEPLKYERNPKLPLKKMPFFPNFLLRDILLWLIVLNVILILAVFFPWELGKKADLFAPAPAGIRPEWYFLFMFQSLKYLPAQIWFIDGEILGIMVFGIAGLLWLLVPFLDKKSGLGYENHIFNYIGYFIIIYIIIFTILGWVL
jgi:quinol-cytochrome oxidoreductase complex cytochrome b subunit